MASMHDPEGENRKILVAVLSNPPLTSGRRTHDRLELARQILGFDLVLIANLFGTPTHSSGDIAAVGHDWESWISARSPIENALKIATGVLIAFGKSEPGGPARQHRRAQVAWTLERVAALNLPVWQLGDHAHHPSRWQRWTFRNHPSLLIRDALTLGLKIRPET